MRLHAMKTCLLLFLSTPFFMLRPAGCQLVGYGRFNGYDLGKGFLGADLSRPLGSCLEGSRHTIPQSGTHVDASIVFTREEYAKALHVDQKADASFLGIGGGGEELHLGIEDKRDTRQYDIIIEATQEVDSATLDAVHWLSPYKDWLESGDAVKRAQVRETCGDRYIGTVFYNKRLFVVIHVSSRINSSLREISGSLKANATVAVITMNTQLGGNGKVTDALRSGAATIDVYSEGMGGIAPTASLLGITADIDLPGLEAKLSGVLTNSSVGQAVNYQLLPSPSFPPNDLAINLMQSQLLRLKDRYEILQLRLDNLGALRNGDERAGLFGDRQTALHALEVQQGKLEHDQILTAATHTGCRRAATPDACQTLVDLLGPVTAVISSELRPRNPVEASVFAFAIDGVVQLPIRTARILGAPGSTLLQNARSIKPDATNVDLVAIIDGPYLDHLEVALLSRSTPTASGVVQLPWGSLTFPAYWPEKHEALELLNVLHADVSQPCRILDLGFPAVEEECLTLVGRRLSEIAYAGSADLVQLSPPGEITYPFTVGYADCFGGRDFLSSGHTIQTHGETDSQPNFSLQRPFVSVAFQVFGAQNALFLTITPKLIFNGDVTPTVVALRSGVHNSVGWSQQADRRYANLPHGDLAPGAASCQATLQ